MDFSQGLLDRIKPQIITFPKAAVNRSSTKEGFPEKCKINRKTPVPEFLCNKVAGLQRTTLFILKKRLKRKCLSANFAKFL